MEFVVLIVAIFAITLLIRRRKKDRERFNNLPEKEKQKIRKRRTKEKATSRRTHNPNYSNN